MPTAFTPFEPLVRQLLVATPDLPATVIAERVGWTGRSRGYVTTSGGCVLSIGRSIRSIRLTG